MELYYFLLCLILNMCVDCFEKRYTDNQNKPLTEADRPFRMLSVNLLWEKSKKVRNIHVYVHKHILVDLTS